MSTSPSARPEATGAMVAVAAAAAAAAEGKRRVAFSAPVPPSKRGWATSGSRAIGGGRAASRPCEGSQPAVLRLGLRAGRALIRVC